MKKSKFKFGSGTLKRVLSKSGKKGISLGNWITAHKKGALVLSMAGVLAATGIGIGSHIHNNQDILPEEPSANYSQADDQLAPEEEEFSILADADDLSALGMHNDMATVEEQAKKFAEEMGATYTGPTVERKNDKTGKTESWVSQEDIDAAVKAGIADGEAGTSVTKVEGNYYVAPDGTVWENEAAYKDFINNKDKTGPVETEGNYYVAPDGTVWASKEDYELDQKGGDGKTVIPVENGTVVEFGEGYRDPNGDYWKSEAEYLEYIKGLNGNTNTNPGNTNTNPGNTNTNPGTGTGTTNPKVDQYGGYVGEDGFYHAADGDLYSSLQDYLNTLDSGKVVTNSSDDYTGSHTTGTGTTTGTTTPQVDQYGGYVGEDGYYHAADGSVYGALQDYLTLTSDNQAGSAVTTYTSEEETTYTQSLDEVAPSVTIQRDQYGGYVGEDGYYHVVYEGEELAFESLEAYLELISFEQEAAKTR